MKKRSLTGRFFLSFKKNLQQQATLILRKYYFLQKTEKNPHFFERSVNFFVDRFAGLRILYLRRIALTVKSREIIL